MPFLKPGVVLEVQEQIVELMEEFSTVEEMYKKGDFNSDTIKFLEMNPVTGEIDTDCRIVKANGVYVDVETVMDATKIPRPIERIQNGDDEE